MKGIRNASVGGKESKHHSIEMSLKLLSNAEEGNVNVQEIKKKELTFFQLLKVLRPYFWPDAGSDGAFLNRCRSSATWLLVSLSKVTSLIAPFYLITATNQLIAGHWSAATIATIIFCMLRLSSVIFKELQQLVYIKVKQQANIELQTLTFKHIHTLSLNWHLSKKTGSVIKAMDRFVSFHFTFHD